MGDGPRSDATRSDSSRTTGEVPSGSARGSAYRPAVDLGPWNPGRSAGDEGEQPPTPGERLYALGQLFRLYRRGELDVLPARFDVWDLAGIIGVRGDIEFISQDRRGSHWHFADEVLDIDCDAQFPWRLLTVWEWTAEADSSEAA